MGLKKSIFSPGLGRHEDKHGHNFKSAEEHNEGEDYFREVGEARIRYDSLAKCGTYIVEAGDHGAHGGEYILSVK